jgi:hypothetical protein
MTANNTRILRRSRQANKDLIDLTDYYTSALHEDWWGQSGANLSTLPQGIQVLAEVAFDVRGVIQLKGQQTGDVKKEQDFPKSVKGIKINHKGKKLHFLHGAVGRVEEDTKIGAYILHYTNGQVKHIPILYQRHVKDWQVQEDAPFPTDAEIAWTEEENASHTLSNRSQVYMHTVNNPFPNAEIATIDFVSALTASAPFLIALTVEPNAPVYERFSMARIDNFCPIKARSPKAGPDLVDLSRYYTSSLDDNWFCHAGHDLRDVPRGIQVLGNVPFDIRGLVQLAASKSLDVTGVVFPEAMKGIAVNYRGSRLHFLQACFWNTDAGAKLGEYVIHYADGQTRSVPIIYGHNILDWWAKPGGIHLSNAESVWQGSNPATRSMGMITHLIKYTWKNPLPETEITTIDFVSDLIEAGPFLVAVTIDNRP